MNNFRRVFYTSAFFLSTIVFGIAQTEGNNSTNSLSNGDVKYSSLAKGLALQSRDFRYNFFTNRKSFEAVKVAGLFLLTYGSPDASRKISTNECATVGAALTKYGGDVSNIQIRIVEQDSIIQTPIRKNENIDAVNAILQLRLHPGDIVILTLVE